MDFNIDKCKVLHIGRKNEKNVYQMNGQPLVSTECEKDVGVIISDNLKPDRQCDEAVRRATAVLNQICRSFHYRDRIGIGLFSKNFTSSMSGLIWSMRCKHGVRGAGPLLTK